MVSIYALKDGEQIFYIGKCKNIRLRKLGHLSSAATGDMEKDIKIRSMIEAGRKLEMVVLKTCEDWEGFEQEREMIQRQITLGHPLVNIVHANHLKITATEIKILCLMAVDMDTNDIAAALFRSPRTIETIRQRIKDKARCKTLTGLMAWAIDKGYATL